MSPGLSLTRTPMAALVCLGVRDIPRPQKQSELPVQSLTLADDPFLDRDREHSGWQN